MHSAYHTERGRTNPVFAAVESNDTSSLPFPSKYPKPVLDLTQSASMITLVTMACFFDTFRSTTLPIEDLKRYVDERVEEEMCQTSDCRTLLIHKGEGN